MKVLRPYQEASHQAAIDALNKGVRRQLNVMATGCHAKDTPILMYDGCVKKVQDVLVGDLLMGDDSSPREVLQLARGRELMYKVIPTKGEPFVVNENHILRLQQTGIKKHHSLDYINISVKDYIQKSNSFKHLFKLYKKEVSFHKHLPLPTHPYWLGLWFGDGSATVPVITTPDAEIEQWFFTEFTEYCKQHHPEIDIKKKVPKHRCLFYYFSRKSQLSRNSLTSIIRGCYINNEKRIPNYILLGSKETRLKFLAGLLDTDGHLSNGGYEIITVYAGLKNDILFLARSLGFAAYFSNKTGTIKSRSFSGQYYRVFISGNCENIPCKIVRKQAHARRQIKNVLVTGFKIEPVGIDDFYGFALNGNHLYLTGDFTVHHNTGKTLCEVTLIEKIGAKKTLWITEREELLHQGAIAFLRSRFDDELADKIDKIGFIDYMRGGGEFPAGFTPGVIKSDLFIPEGNVVFTSAQTLWRRLDKLPPNMFDYVVADEAHLYLAKTYSQGVNHFNPMLLRGLSVGPDSYVEIKGKYFKDGFVGNIENLWNILSEKYTIHNVDEYEIVYLKDTFSRGWENGQFYWKPIKSFIRHKCTKDCSILSVAGDKLLLTNDHSIFIAKGNKHHTTLVSEKTSNVNVKDVAVYETGWENEGDKTIDVIPILKKLKLKAKIHVNVDLSGITHETFKEYGIGYKKKWEYLGKGKRGVHGQFLPFKKYLEMRHLLPEPQKLYYEGGTTWIKSKIKLSDWAYFIGFFYGDGWFGQSKKRTIETKKSSHNIGLAVEHKLVPKIIGTIESLKHIKVNYSIKKGKGKSVQIDISNTLFVALLKYFINDKRCYDKRIHPSFILTWRRKQRISLLEGLIDSDGHLRADKTKRTVAYTTTSPLMTKTLMSLLRSVGVKGHINKRKGSIGSGGIINGRKISGKRDSYSVGWSYYAMIGDNSGHKGTSQRQRSHTDLNFIEAPIKEIKSANKPEYVYDFEMSGHPSFVANGVLVHNTATPYRGDGLPMGDMFDEIVFEYGMRDGIRDGYLCSMDGVRVKTTVNLDSVHTLAGDFNQKELSDEVNTLARNNLCADSYLKYGKGRQGIFFAVDIQHAIDLTEAFLQKGVRATAISSNEELTGDRGQKVKEFKDGKHEVAINVNILTTGFDHPDVGIIGCAAPTKSKTRYVQAVGRGSRLKSEGFVSRFGQNCIILDFVDNTSKHSLINAHELDKGLPPEERVFITEENRQKLIDAREQRSVKITHFVKEDEKINLLEVPKIRVSKSIRMREPATEKQLAVIEKWGYDVKNNTYTKGMIQKIFDEQPASDAQLRLLRAFKYDVDNAGFISIVRFKECMKEIETRPNFKPRPANR